MDYLDIAAKIQAIENPPKETPPAPATPSPEPVSAPAEKPAEAAPAKVEEPKPQLEGTQVVPEAQEAPPQEDVPAERPKKSGVQKRIDELVAEREAWKRAALAQAEKPSAYQPQQAQPPTRQQEQELPFAFRPKPTLEQFKDSADPYADLADAIADWRYDRKVAENNYRTQVQQQQQQQQQLLERQSRWFDEAKTELGEDHFDSLCKDPSFGITPPMVTALMDSDVGVHLLDYLDKHRDQVTEIGKLSPIGQVRAIGKLEDRLIAQAEKVVAEAELAKKQQPNQPNKVQPPGTGAPPVKASPDSLMEKYKKSGDLVDLAKFMMAKGL